MSIDFTGVSAVTIPEGNVVKVTRKSNGAVLWEKILGVKIGTLDVGTKVKMNVKGTARNFIVVHQGKPSSAYDSSCDGAWLLMEDLYESRVWDSSNNDYANSDIHSYLNNTFVNLFDIDIKSVIKQVKLPYTNGTGSGGSLKTGANGISAKVFLLSYTELGCSGGSTNAEGAAVSYFNGADNSKRIGKLNGSATSWWLRSPNTGNTSRALSVGTLGITSNSSVANSYGVRPALVLPSTTLVDENNNVIG